VCVAGVKIVDAIMDGDASMYSKCMVFAPSLTRANNIWSAEGLRGLLSLLLCLWGCASVLGPKLNMAFLNFPLFFLYFIIKNVIEMIILAVAELKEKIKTRANLTKTNICCKIFMFQFYNISNFIACSLR
jgi:hypothetical protein